MNADVPSLAARSHSESSSTKWGRVGRGHLRPRARLMVGPCRHRSPPPLSSPNSWGRNEISFICVHLWFQNSLDARSSGLWLRLFRPMLGDALHQPVPGLLLARAGGLVDGDLQVRNLAVDLLRRQ